MTVVGERSGVGPSRIWFAKWHSLAPRYEWTWTGRPARGSVLMRDTFESPMIIVVADVGGKVQEYLSDP